MEAIVDASRVEDGAMIGGRYRLEHKIGEGGMASVWRAVDTTLDRPVALKFLYARDPRQRDQMSTAFMREAKIAAAVRHRYVVNILDFGTFGDQTPYMVMELLEGESLGQLLAREGPLPPEVVVDLTAHVLEGLTAVHEAGIVHRDLKPENVFIQRERTRALPKLLDFGISRSVESEGGRRSALTTQDGKLIGTPEYMSPEQASGEGDVDLRADLYSLGVIMYEALSGKLPFEAEGMGTLIVQIILGNCEPLHQLRPDLPPALSSFVARAMAKDRGERFQDAVEMHRALVAVAGACFDGKLVQAISIPPSPSAVFAGSPTLPAGMDGQSFAIEAASAEGARPAPEAAERPKRTTRREQRRRGVAVWLGAIVASAATALGISYILQRPEPAEASQHFILVRDADKTAETASSDNEAPSAQEADSTLQPDPEPEEATTAAQGTDDDSEPSAPAGKARARKPSGDSQAALARTFARHKQRIGKCFDPVSDPPTLSLHLSLDRAGHVQSAEISPPAEAETTLGKCIARVVKAIEFGPQARELSLRVPLAVRTERQ